MKLIRCPVRDIMLVENMNLSQYLLSRQGHDVGRKRIHPISPLPHRDKMLVKKTPCSSRLGCNIERLKTMTPHEKELFIVMLEQLQLCKTALRLSRDMAYKYNDTVYVSMINDALVFTDARIERVNEYLNEMKMKQKKGQ